MDEYYMNLAIVQSKKALKKNEVPVGAIIVKNNKVISKGYNKKEQKNNAIKHAEIIAIEKACKKLKNWRLEDCILYVTMEPCMMCCGAIEQSRIKKIVYAIENQNFGYTHDLKNVEIVSGVHKNICRDMVQTFFQKKR